MRRSTNCVSRSGDDGIRSRQGDLQQPMSDRFRKLSRIVGCLLSLGFLSAQPFSVERGSSVVAIYSQKDDYVVVAAESRNEDFNHKPLNDQACKIISLGNDTVFFETGIPVIGVLRGSNWNAQSVARAVYRRSKLHDPKSLSIAWGNGALKWFYGQPAQDLQAITEPDGGIITGGFINFTKVGTAPIQTQTIFYSASANSLSRRPRADPPQLGQIAVSGVATELVDEFFKGNTTRAQLAFGPIGTIRRIGEDPTIDASLTRKAIQFAIDYSIGADHDAIGGPIDIAIIRKNLPIEWIARKKECYEQDQKPLPPVSSAQKKKSI
jgi:hypothetical protein